jgi:hypothetical protein
VRKVLTVEGLVVNKRLPKHNFTSRDLNRILLTLWTQDDLIFIHERYRIQFTFIIRVYCWTGARFGAYFTNGLRYRDIDVELQRLWKERFLNFSPSWTFQEIQLSWRVLRCGGEELAWQCRTHSYLESDPGRSIDIKISSSDASPRTTPSTRPLDDTQNMNSFTTFQRWYQMVETFSSRKLTYLEISCQLSRE